MVLLLTGAAARADDDDDPPHITVRGSASVQPAPDLAVLRLAVEAEDGDAAAALRAGAAALDGAREAAAGQGVAAADIQPGSLRLERASPAASQPPAEPRAEPRVEPRTDASARVFRAVATLRVRLLGSSNAEPAKVEAVLAALVAGGAKQGAAKAATTVEGVDYRLADPAAALAEATGLAVADARRRAEAAASAAHVKLGAVLSIEPPDEPAGGTRLDRVPRDAAPGAVSTTVEVSYEIER